MFFFLCFPIVNDIQSDPIYLHKIQMVLHFSKFASNCHEEKSPFLGNKQTKTMFKSCFIFAFNKVSFFSNGNSSKNQMTVEFFNSC